MAKEKTARNKRIVQLRDEKKYSFGKISRYYNKTISRTRAFEIYYREKGVKKKYLGK